MAVVTGIFSVISWFGMAGNATDTMITVKPEISVMIECCRVPLLLAMAFRAITLCITMQEILRFFIQVAY